VIIWLIKTFGIDEKKIPVDSETYLVFNNAPTSWLVFVYLIIILASVIFIWKIYSNEHTVCSLKKRRILALTRIVILLILSIVFLDPSIGIRIKKLIEPHILVLVDNSASMKLNDFYIQKDAKEGVKGYLNKGNLNGVRLDILKKALGDYELDKNLKEKGIVSYYQIDREVKTSKNENGLKGLVQGIKGTGLFSDITGGVRNAISQHKGKTISGIVLMTDGQVNGGRPLDELTKYLQDKNVPAYVVGLGSPYKAKNVKINDLWIPTKIFKGDPFQVQIRINAKEVTNEALTVELYEIPVLKDGKLNEENKSFIKKKEIVWNGGLVEQKIVFNHTAEKEGKYAYRVVIPKLEYESVVEDNIKQNITEIISKKAKLLLISGVSSWEYRLVKTLFERDKTIDLSCWLQSMDLNMVQEGNIPITSLPDTEEDLFKYDVIVLLDPNPIDFDEKWFDILEKFIDKNKGGVLFNAGPKYSIQMLNLYATANLKKILPVKFSKYQREHTDFLKVTFGRLWPMKLTNDGRGHFISQYYKEVLKNEEVWQKLPGIYWSFPAIEAKPGAKILIEHSNPRLIIKENKRPLLIAGQYGSGRTLYKGFTSTWRWKRLGEKYFDQFWVKAVRYLLEGKLGKGNKYGSLYTVKEMYYQGDMIQVNAQLFDEFLQPLKVPTVKAELFQGSNKVQEVKLKQIPNRIGYYEAEFPARLTGEIELKVDNLVLEAKGKKLTHQFKIEMPLFEYDNPEMNKLGLTNLVTSTKGKFYNPIDLNNIGQDFPNRKEIIMINKKPIQLWDNMRLLIFLLVLISFEWFYRKKNKLL